MSDWGNREINKVIERYIWLGDKTNGTGNMSYVDGFLTLFADDTDVVTESILSGTTAIDGLLQVYLSMTEETLALGGVIFVSPAIYKAFLMDLFRLNYYHYAGPMGVTPDEFALPGSDNVMVIKTPGLAGSLKVVGTFADNLFYATDVDGDETDLDLWWSQDDRLFKWQAKWMSGVGYYFPAEIVVGTFAAAPAATTGANAALAAIAANTGDIKTNTGTIATKSAGLDNLAGMKTDLDAIKAADEAVAGTVDDGAIVTKAASA